MDSKMGYDRGGLGQKIRWMIDFLSNPCCGKYPQINQILIVPLPEFPGLGMSGFLANNGDKSERFREPRFFFAKARKILDFLLKRRDLNSIGSISNCQIESSRL
jgi:hypothetical protein